MSTTPNKSNLNTDSTDRTPPVHERDLAIENIGSAMNLIDLAGPTHIVVGRGAVTTTQVLITFRILLLLPPMLFITIGLGSSFPRAVYR